MNSLTRYGLARKLNPKTGQKAWCIAAFIDDYPYFPVHFFDYKPDPAEVAEYVRRGPELELRARNDHVLQFVPYGVSDGFGFVSMFDPLVN